MAQLPPPLPPQYRLAGALMVTSGLTNLAFASIWALSLSFVCIGIYWIVPMSVAVGEFVVGVLALLGIRLRFLPIAAVIGTMNGALLFNFGGVALQIGALLATSVPGVRNWIAEEPNREPP